jgi:hypothetical protein
MATATAAATMPTTCQRVYFSLSTISAIATVDAGYS